MANLGFIFDANQVAPQASSPQLPVSPPEGWPAVIVASEFEATKNSTPQNPASFLKLTVELIDGPAKGARGYDRLNLQNPNPKTVEIAYSTLSAYCHVTGAFRLDNTEALHGKPFRVLVRKQKESDNTEIYGVKDINGNDPGKGGSAQPQQPTAPPQAPQAPVYQAPAQVQTAAAPQQQWTGQTAAAPTNTQPQPAYTPPGTAQPGTAPGVQPPWQPAGAAPAPPWQK